jgi:hypothetical protein
MPPCAPRFWKAVAAELMLFDAAGAYFAVARQEYAPFALVTPHDLNPDAVVAVGAVTVKATFVESLEFSVHLASSFSRKPPVSGSVVNGLSIAFSVECLCYRLLNDQFTGHVWMVRAGIVVATAGGVTADSAIVAETETVLLYFHLEFNY